MLQTVNEMPDLIRFVCHRKTGCDPAFQKHLGLKPCIHTVNPGWESTFRRLARKIGAACDPGDCQADTLFVRLTGPGAYAIPLLERGDGR